MRKVQVSTLLNVIESINLHADDCKMCALHASTILCSLDTVNVLFAKSLLVWIM